ncbi:MAG TPA: DNA polymerase III subunit delta' C-terminal domain-containing protein [Clostridia bacterium]|nr:DNA polymerase III subunit delta' C-terminal domain-containing protein [Clostridia bacterium]
MSTGANRAFDMLSSAIASGKAFHAFFISSSDEDAGLSLARRAAALCCLGRDDEPALLSCPDYHQLKGEETGAKEIRSLIDELSKASFGGGKRAIVISNAHALSREAQNTLLKTLEEPPQGVMFLLCGNADGMLSTITSRCAVVRLGHCGYDEIEAELIKSGASAADARLYASLSCLSMGRGIRLFKSAEYREHRDRSLSALISALNGELPSQAAKALAKAGAADALTFMLSFMADALTASAGIGRRINNIDRQDAINSTARRFTSAQILCIIEMITKASESLYMASGGDMYPAAVIDGLFLRIIKELK